VFLAKPGSDINPLCDKGLYKICMLELCNNLVMFLQVLSEKLPELLDFPKDLSSLELAAKV
jgi:hypothetical protein